MTSLINQQMNQNQQQQFAATNFNNPQLQNVNADKIKKKSALRSVGETESKNSPEWLTPALTIPVWIGMGYGMDKFNKACAGNYEDSILGKVNTWGEKVGKDMPLVDKFFAKIDKGVELFKTKIIAKSKILSSFFNVPTNPASSMALMMSRGTPLEVASDAVDRMEEFLKIEGNTLVGTDIKEIEKIKESLKKPAHCLDAVKRLGEICSKQDKNLSFELEHFWGVPFSKKLTGNARYFSEIPGFKKVFGRKVHFSEYANKIKALIAPKGETKIGQKLPSAMLKTIEGITNGTAGGKLAILMAAFFVADAIKKSIEAPNKNGEKRKVFAENMLSNIGMYVTMPISVMAMHHFGGLKYIGMGKGEDIKVNVEQYREKLEKFNKDVDAGLLKDKALYKARKKELIELLKGDTKLSFKNDKTGKTLLKSITNILHKPLKLFGRAVTIGLERIKPYDAKPASVLGQSWKFIKNIPYHAKGIAGWPTRFLLFAMVTAPFFGDWFAKASHLVFGRPSKSILDRESEKKNELPPQPVQQPQVQQVYQAQRPQPAPAVPAAIAATAAAQPIRSAQPAQMQSVKPAQVRPAVVTVQQSVPGQAPMMVTVQQGPTKNVMIGQPVAQNHFLPPNAIVPARPLKASMVTSKTEPTNPKNVVPQQPVRRYIPSSEPVKVHQQQADPQLQSILGKSYAAENAANKFLEPHAHE